VGFVSLAPLRSKSLDTLFHLRGPIPLRQRDFTNHVAVLWINGGAAGDWTPYTNLLDTLTPLSPKAIVFDLVFTNEVWTTNFPAFSNAVARASVFTKIVFASEAVKVWSNEVSHLEEPLLPCISSLAQAHAGNVAIGLANLSPNTDDIVRFYSSTSYLGRKPLAFAVADLFPPSAEPADFAINYYGGSNTIPNYSFMHLQETNFLAQLAFKDKAVFVGENTEELLNTPLSQFATDSLTRTEVQATAYANLVSDNGCIRDAFGLGEGLLCLLIGIIAGWVCVQWPPLKCLLIAVVCSMVVFGLSVLLFHFAFSVPWIVIAGIQMPAAFVLSLLPVRSTFISHRGADTGTAHLICEGLEKWGVEVYFDLKERDVGLLNISLMRQVEQRRVFLLVVTNKLQPFAKADKAKQTVDWVGEEIAMALSARKKILLVFVSDPPNTIGDLKALPAVNDYKALYTNLEFSLKGELYRHFRVPFTIGHLESSVLQIVQTIPFGVRKAWRKRPYKLKEPHKPEHVLPPPTPNGLWHRS
jgi:CHASE2 domain-containing sensor protein